MLTGPVTCSVRWNEPSAEANAGREAKQASAIMQAKETETPMRVFMVSPFPTSTNMHVARAGVNQKLRPSASDLALNRAMCMPQIALDRHGDGTIDHHTSRTRGRI